MSLPGQFTVRTEASNLQDGRAPGKIYLSPAAFKAHKISVGDVVVVSGHPTNQNFAPGAAWPSSSVAENEIRVSRTIMRTAGLSDGQEARLFLPDPTHSHPVAGDILVDELSEDGDGNALAKTSKGGSKARDWLSLAVREALVEQRYITTAQIVEIAYEGRTRVFRVNSAKPLRAVSSVESLESRLDSLKLGSTAPSFQIWAVNWDTQVSLNDGERQMKPELSQIGTRHETPYASVGGLDKEIAEIRDLIEIPLTRPDLFQNFGLKPPRGILLHGPPGTGKTHLARTIASSSRTYLLTISGPELSSSYHGETEQRLREVFEEAKRQSPCIIVIDEVDALCPKREDTGGGVEGRVVATLLTLLDGIENKISAQEATSPPRVVVVATTNRPNAIDPALRRPGRFDREIEIGVPDASARLSILKVLLSKIPHSVPPEELERIAKSTHGYVGADLAAVVRTAGTMAIKRSLQESQSTLAVLTSMDLIQAISAHQPSALREYSIEVPTTKWTDIGGQALVRQKLKESVEWPLVHPEAFRRLGVVPPKGILLYGPPGCSKTLTAKALANESGINFLAVKGAELLNKYVGESERAVREIFRKARAASPSIIFFDEIDAIATARESYADSHDGVLTTLLNEMDGIQELVGVTIVAATNRPDAIDPALMRPGRLDRILYVGLPDLNARKEILQIKLAKMAVDPELDIEELALSSEGCSGAELASLCQDAALAAMQDDINTQFVRKTYFLDAARSMRRQVTPEMVQSFEDWRNMAGVRSA